MLLENGMQQLVTQPTHILGNVLDLICTNNSKLITDIDVISPGLSDHHIITAKVNHVRQTTLQSAPKVIKLYKRVNTTDFRKSLQSTCDQLEGMNNPSEMWALFKRDLSEACERHIPKKFLEPVDSKWPVWFDKDAKKLAVSKTEKDLVQISKDWKLFFLTNTELKEDPAKRVYVKRRKII